MELPSPDACRRQRLLIGECPAVCRGINHPQSGAQRSPLLSDGITRPCKHTDLFQSYFPHKYDEDEGFSFIKHGGIIIIIVI